MILFRIGCANPTDAGASPRTPVVFFVRRNTGCAI